MINEECFNAELLYRKIKRYFNGQETCTSLVGHYSSIEIVLILYRENIVSIFRVVSLFATDVLMWIYYFILR